MRRKLKLAKCRTQLNLSVSAKEKLILISESKDKSMSSIVEELVLNMEFKELEGVKSNNDQLAFSLLNHNN